MNDIEQEAIEVPVVNERLQLIPSIITIMGLPLTGKSLVSQELGLLSNLHVLDVDTVRQQHFPVNPFAPRDEERERVDLARAYEINHKLAMDTVLAGSPVLLVATYSRQTYHDALRELQRLTNVPFISLMLTIPPHMVAEVVARRLAQRQTEASLSNIRTLDNFNDVAARYQEFPGAEIINASLPLGDVVNAVIEKIHALNEK